MEKHHVRANRLMVLILSVVIGLFVVAGTPLMLME